MSISAANSNMDRRRVIGLLAAATAQELRSGVASFDGIGAIVDMKPAETGLVMLRGRIGGDGAAFNAGEATVSKAVVQIAGGAIGYGFRLGRDLPATRDAAILDALWQAPAMRGRIEAAVLAPISARLQAARTQSSAEAAATRVNFFTLARETT